MYCWVTWAWVLFELSLADRSIYWYRLVEKAKNSERMVSTASAQMTERVFSRQTQLRKSFLHMIEYSGMMEKETLQEWKKIIQRNTHPR